MRVLNRVIAWIFAACAGLAPHVPDVPVTIRFNEHPFAERRYGKAISGGQTILGSVIASLRVLFGLVTPARLAIVLVLVALLTTTADAETFLLANAGVVTLASKRAELDRLLGEMEGVQKKYQGQIMPKEVAEQFDTNATTAAGIQDEIQAELKRQNRFQELNDWGGEIENPTLPVKRTDVVPEGAVAGWMTLGEFVTAQENIQRIMAARDSRGLDGVVPIKASLLSARQTSEGHVLVPLTGVQVKQIRELYQTKTVPSLGTGVISNDRLPGITQVTADDELVLRSVFSIGQTDSNVVEYVRRSAQTRAAAETAHGAAKPESAVEFDLATATVRTIAAWMPVHVQQLADWPLLRSEIDNFLLYDLRKREEEQIIYGSGSGSNLHGLEKVSGTTDIAALTRYVSSIHTLIDVIRMGITEVRTAGYRPNAVLLHPIDWEDIVLLKATDNNYIWVVVTTENGSRLWGLRVVESESMQENAGNPTEQRNLIVGDYQRGCQIVDRMQSQVSVGLNNDDFTKNIRTILAEERIAFPVRAPAAFAKFETQALAT